MSATRSVHVRIEGRVQGVGYRAWVEMSAREFGLEGWVRNRADRSVEAVFQGPADAVADMLKRCEEGPRAAHVTRVEVLGEPADRCAGFEVRATA